ncbi:hypothetical protein C8R44DRAFT_791609 [Mycena epipterygia]|nr:hypothetical protein C8R44DRAFT_791609 [Mycena epipterygia]
MSSSANKLPKLPEDVERLIFEIAAFLRPPSMPALILVAQRVKAWIEPILYSVLNLCSAPEPDKPMLQLPLDTIRDFIKSRPTFLQAHVRHIRLYGFDDDAYADFMQILSLCKATIDLQLLLAESPTLLPLLGQLPLQRLAVNVGQLFPTPATTDFLHPALTQITHLHLFDWHDGGWEPWSGLAKMPRLTHLSFLNNLVPNNVWMAALTHCKSLEVLAIVCSDERGLDNYAPDGAELGSDPRFVMVVVTDTLVDWESGARGRRDYWERADEFVAKRRMGKIKGFTLKSTDY